LPETIRIDLSSIDAVLWGGITAVMRPLDVEEFMRWVDAFPGQDTAHEAAGVLIKQQLVTIEGVDLRGLTVRCRERRALQVALLDGEEGRRRDRPHLQDVDRAELARGRRGKKLRLAIRLGHSKQFGGLSCGSCDKKTRDKFHCGLPGEERPELKPAQAFVVQMGGVRKSVRTTRCPWSVALKDGKVGQWLRTYWLVKDLGFWPPGRSDPQLLDAFAVIAAEHNAIQSEELENMKRG